MPHHRSFPNDCLVVIGRVNGAIVGTAGRAGRDGGLWRTTAHDEGQPTLSQWAWIRTCRDASGRPAIRGAPDDLELRSCATLRLTGLTRGGQTDMTGDAD
jgi:hypothetical protein